jgi:hypothetical protein
VRRVLWSVLILVIVALPAAAQSEEALRLHLNRDFGYGGLGQIQGLFSLSASGPAEVTRVVFWVDEEVLGEDGEAPFRLQFHTDSFSPGVHVLHATGHTGSGGSLRSDELRVEFLSAAQAGQATLRMVVPLVGIVAVIVVIMGAATVLSARRKGPVPPGQPRSYGWAGGSICPRCRRPFALNWFAPRMGLGRLVPCPHCGKWSVVRRRPLAELRAAEAAELAGAEERPHVAGLSEDEALRRELEDSRYRDM